MADTMPAKRPGTSPGGPAGPGAKPVGGPGVKPAGATAIKPVGWDRTGWEAFKYLLYDPSTGAVLTRTPLSWLKITVFYIIYYTFLTGFWTLCLFVFFQTLPYPEDGPSWQLDYSLIGDNPGVGLRPRNRDYRIDSQMFVLKDGDMQMKFSELKGEGDENADYAERVRLFFGNYINRTVAPATKEDPPIFKGYHLFNLTTLGDCGNHPYGYVSTPASPKIAPCIFIKLNNIWGWSPRPVECGNPMENGADGWPKDDCPKTAKAHIESELVKNVRNTSVFIDCNGRNPADKEAVAGGLKYFPATRAINTKFFPYTGQRSFGNDEIGYHAPLVALQVTLKPQFKGQLVHIECKAYFRGVKHNKKERLGLVQFEVQII